MWSISPLALQQGGLEPGLHSCCYGINIQLWNPFSPIHVDRASVRIISCKASAIIGSLQNLFAHCCEVIFILIPQAKFMKIAFKSMAGQSCLYFGWDKIQSPIYAKSGCMVIQWNGLNEPWLCGIVIQKPEQTMWQLRLVIFPHLSPCDWRFVIFTWKCKILIYFTFHNTCITISLVPAGAGRVQNPFRTSWNYFQKD